MPVPQVPVETLYGAGERPFSICQAGLRGAELSIPEYTHILRYSLLSDIFPM